MSDQRPTLVTVWIAVGVATKIVKESIVMEAHLEALLRSKCRR